MNNMKMSPTQPCVLGIFSQYEGKSLCGFIKYTKVGIKKKQSADSEGFRWELTDFIQNERCYRKSHRVIKGGIKL